MKAQIEVKKDKLFSTFFTFNPCYCCCGEEKGRKKVQKMTDGTKTFLFALCQSATFTIGAYVKWLPVNKANLVLGFLMPKGWAHRGTDKEQQAYR